jgi:hypothetical protein
MIPLLDYSAIADLRRQMQGAPDIQPMPQAPIRAPMQEAPPPHQMLPVAEPQIPPMPQIEQRQGLLSRINNIGKPTLDSETRSLLTPEQANKAESGGGLLGRTALQLLTYGIATPGMQAKMRAKSQIADNEWLAKVRTGRDQQAALANLQSAFIPRIMAARTPDERYEAMAQFSAARAAILGPEAMGTAPNMLQALEPPRPVAAQPRAISRQENVLGDDGKPYIVYSDADGNEIRRVPQFVKPDKPDKPEPARKQLVQIPKADGTIEYRWLSEGETALGEKAPPKDIKVINTERSLAYDDAQLSIRELTNEKGDVKPPPSSWDRWATKSDWTNWASTGEGQAYMNNTRKLIRAWVVLIEGKRMSDADAAVNEAMRSFRPGDKGAVVAGKQRTLKSMAESIGRLGGKKGVLLPDPTAKAEAEPSEEDMVRAYKALGPRATDAEVDAWIIKNPRKP